MEANERQHVLDHLTASRAKLLDSLEGLTAQQWEFRPEEGRWSIEDCLEHVILVEGRIQRLIVKTMQGEPAPDKKAEAAAMDQFLKDGTAQDRTRKFNAPEMMHPKKTFADSVSLLTEFENTRARTMEFVASLQGDLRSHFYPHMVFGELDCYQWLMLLPNHCERHLAQIEEIKSSANFPA